MKMLKNPPRRPNIDHARDDASYTRAHKRISAANRRIISAAWDAAHVSASADASTTRPDCGDISGEARS